MPLASVSELTVIGPVSLPRPLLGKPQQHSIRLFLVDELGRAVTTMEPFVTEADAAGALAQMDASRNPEMCLEIGRHLIAAKLHNYAALAAAYRKSDSATDCEHTLRRLSTAALHASALDELLGLEGSGAVSVAIRQPTAMVGV